MDFNTAFNILVDPQHEGAYSNDANDPGNWTGGKKGVGTLKGTMYGVSAASYPGEDIANLTLDRAKAIYARDFWGPAGCDALPDLLKYEMFDLAVNTSAPGKPATAIKILQAAVGTMQDGILGPKTLQAAQSLDPNRALRRLQAGRLRYYTGLVNWPAYGKGWVNRVATNMMGA